MLVEALTVDPDKIISKGIKSVSERVINLKPIRNFPKIELMDYLNNFRRFFLPSDRGRIA